MDSRVETFVALRLEINSWRWKGVPFYIRAGKCLPVTATEVIVKLRQSPAVFAALPPPANYFRFRVTPNLMIAIGALVKKAGDQTEGQQVDLVISKESDPSEMGLTRNSCSMLCRETRSVSRAKITWNRHGESSIPFWMMRLSHLHLRTGRLRTGRSE